MPKIIELSKQNAKALLADLNKNLALLDRLQGLEYGTLKDVKELNQAIEDMNRAKYLLGIG